MTASTLPCHASYIPINTDSTSNLGLGTTTPQASLVVTNGNVGLGTWTAANARLETDGFKLSTSPSAGYVLVSGSTGIGTWMAAGTLATSGGSPGGSSGQIQYNSSGSFAGIVNSAVDASGNVGLGTTLSTNKLDVSGGVGIGSAYAGYFAAPANGLIVQGGVGIGTSSVQSEIGLTVMKGNVGIGTWAPGSAFVVMNGNVGIGSTFPSQPFVVYQSGHNTTLNGSNLDFDNSTTASVRNVNTSTGAVLNIVGSQAKNGQINLISTLSASADGSESVIVKGGVTGSTSLAAFRGNGNFGVGTISPYATIQVIGNIGIGTGKSSSFQGVSPPLGGMIVEGNVGLGTTIAQAQLVSWGNVGLGTWTAANARLETDGFRLYSGPAAGYVLVSSSTGIGTWMAASTLATSGGSPGGSSGQIQYNSSSSFAGIANSNVTASGNMGLGTTLSTNKLDVSGSVGIGSTYAGYYGVNSNGLIVQGNVGIGTYAPSKALDVNGDVGLSGSGDSYLLGNVGIGSSAPGTALDIQGTARTTSFQLNTNPAAGYVLVSSSTGIGTWMAGTTLSVSATPGGSSGQIQYNSSSSFAGITNSSVNASGNIGLGTTLSTNKLDVSGGVGIGSSYAGYFASPSDGLIVQGNVGIGTTTPQDKFIVNGGNIGLGTWTTRVPLDIIGIGTTASRGGGVLITNGNLGVNTTVPRAILEVKNSLAYSSVYDNGNSSTAITINWNTGNNQSVTMTGNCTFTFTAPGGIQRLLLMLTQDGTGSRTATWPAAVKWPAGSTPVLTTTASAVDIMSCLFNGTNYYCTMAQDLR